MRVRVAGSSGRQGRSLNPGAGDATSRDGTAGEAVEVALLDRDGVIVEVNEAWSTFARDNGGDPARTGIGASYLAACESAADDPDAARVAAGIRAACAGDLWPPVTVRIPSHAPDRPRSFDVSVSSRYASDGVCVGATVTLTPTVEPARPAPNVAQGSGRSLPELSFPDGPRLQLEEAIGLLKDHAENVLHAQGRLRALLRASTAVASDLSMAVVLRQIVSAARELVGARSAALGVVGHDGALAQFIPEGPDVGIVARMTAWPGGGAWSDTVLRYPQHHLAGDVWDPLASAGDGGARPPPKSLLVVPIGLRDRVFGTLYLIESLRGEFTAEDEQLVSAFASSASSAIENARLYQETEQHRKWLAASAEVTQQLFAGTTDQHLELVVRFAAKGADADLANLVLSTGEGDARRWSVQAAVGLLADRVMGAPVDGATAVGQVIRSGKPVLLDDYASQVGDGGLYSFHDSGLAVGSMVCAPLLAQEKVVGVMSVGRVAGRGLFTQTDMEQLAVFTGHAGRALELAVARDTQVALLRMEDHERIAADLHDHQIRELFTIGIGLQGLVHRLPALEDKRKALGYADAIDDVITRIRATVFELQESRPTQQNGLRESIHALLEDHAASLGIAPSIEFIGQTDTIPSQHAEDVVAAVREGLTSSARHDRANRAAVRIRVTDVLVEVEVTDDTDAAPFRWTAAFPSDGRDW